MKKFQTTAVAAFLALLTAGAVGAEAQQAAATFFQKVGSFQVGFATVTGSYKGSAYNFDFRGGPGGKVRATTARYDLTAPRIQMLITPVSSPETAQATGGVAGEARDPDRQQVISFSGDQAVYKAGGKNAPARIDLTGNVRFIFRSPQFSASDPMTIRGSSGYIIFAPDGSVNYGLNNGGASGTAVDAPKKKP